MQSAYERAGLAVEFVPMPHKRSLQSADEGSVDGEVGRIEGIEKNYPDLVRVPVKVIDLLACAYVLDRSPIRRYSPNLLNELKVCAVFGVQWAKDLLNCRTAEMVSDYDKLMAMLVEKRVDMVLGSALSVEAVLSKKGDWNKHVRRLNPPASCQPLYHYVHKNNARLVPLLEKALRELWAEGRWNTSPSP
ncbi:ABC transporter substrate-binding protein [Pseudodesulfovibrio portus]|uniref:ABC transporter substrate-binding protein n=1 Tax=Pseudodesulfovibrio portus TaxID=231439 RepID=A0ABM8AT21_9BACT|nr:ABC transporter substrate-binding protein [Pseudodesulfovibrio portus]